jgi:hypothetical protein
LDKQVHDWLEEHAGLSLDISRTTAYQRYVETLTAWGEKYSQTPVQVEKAIFGLAMGYTARAPRTL